MGAWAFSLALRFVPASWRATIRADVEEEARASNRGAFWCAWQVLRVTPPLQFVVGGEAMWTDLRQAVRSLVRARWFTVGAIATFALGIGVNVAVFSAVDRILFRTLPYAAPHELVLLRQCNDK